MYTLLFLERGTVSMSSFECETVVSTIPLTSPRSPCHETKLNISNGTYEGDLLHCPNASNGTNKIRNGRGKMRYFNGNTYIGEWIDDKFDGIGEYFWADGRKFVGTFKKDKIDGKGTGLWPDGRTYSGEYRMDLAHGSGRVTLSDGRIFEGIFESDYPVEGQMIESDGTTFLATFDGKTHVSEWKPRKRTLIGKFEDGWRGQDISNSLHEFSWKDGRHFAGNFKEFCPTIGVLTEANGTQFLVTYTGSKFIAYDPSPSTKLLLKTEVRSFNEMCFM
jgi:hypothetical protein